MEKIVITKVCSKCKQPKPLIEFNKRIKSKDGYRGQCKKCEKEWCKDNPEKVKQSKVKWRENNIEKDKELKKKWYYINSNISKENNKNWRKDNPNRAKETDKNWKKLNSEKVKRYKKKYRDNNPEKIKKYGVEYNKKIPHIIAWRLILTNSLKRLGKTKEGHTIDLLGYSALDLNNHMITLFTEGMSWDNHGEWHIDHIKPVSKFDKETPMDIVNALTNLQPLWVTTREINGIVYEGNLNKNNKY